MTVPKGKPNQPANAEIVTVEEAILCANKTVHFGSEFFKDQDPAVLLQIAEGFNGLAGLCGPHSYATRERIVTAWTEKPL